jgi:SAM-dependent methyltransferase
LGQHGVRLTETTAFEFGAGWFLLKQLLLSLYGCRHQITVDLRRLATIKLVNEALAKLAACSQSLGTIWRPIRQISSFEDLYTHYGISYLAPSDARACGLPDRSVDLVSSTATLEHVPPDDIRAIMRESHRILRVRGLAVHYVDYTDHFAHFDKSISVYNFLQFSEDEWKSYNSFIHYQNRLRHVEYVTLFAEAGFQVLEENRHVAGPPELASLERMRIAPEFAAFSLEQLSVQGALFVLKRAAS